MARRVIEIYFDYASPFAYLASGQLEGIARRHQTLLAWRPIQLSKLPRDPYSVSKRKYLNAEALRSAQMLGVPLLPAVPSPVRSDTALLLALVCQEAGIFQAYHRAVFQAAWSRQLDIGQREVLEECLRGTGAEPKPLLDRAKASAVKARLTALQVDAESRGVFGVPTMVLQGELFFGLDQLAVLEWRLSGEETPPSAFSF